MPIYKADEVVAWLDNENKIICTECGDPGEAKPLITEDFDSTDIVICDLCEKTRIQ